MAQDSIWFRIGYALEQARTASAPSRLRSLVDRLPDRSGRKNGPGKADRPDEGDGSGGALDALLVTGGGALLSRLLGLRAARHRPGVSGLARAGAAGAGAALLRELVHPLLHGELRAPRFDGELGDALLAGAARGLVYASLVEPRIPGPSAARGVLFGTTEYLAAPWGGLTRLAGRHAPHRRIPLFSSLFEGYDPSEDTFVDHIAFAVALAVLYGYGTADPGDDPEVMEDR